MREDGILGGQDSAASKSAGGLNKTLAYVNDAQSSIAKLQDLHTLLSILRQKLSNLVISFFRHL